MRRFACVSGYSVPLPQRKTRGSAGYDIASACDVTILPGESKLIPTGLKAYMPDNEVMLLFLRSSLALKRGLILPNGVGVIDSDYADNPDNEGHFSGIVYNPTDKVVTIAKGERFMQAVFVKFGVTDDDEAEGTRQGGWGSTGVK